MSRAPAGDPLDHLVCHDGDHPFVTVGDFIVEHEVDDATATRLMRLEVGESVVVGLADVRRVR